MRGLRALPQPPRGCLAAISHLGVRRQVGDAPQQALHVLEVRLRQQDGRGAMPDPGQQNPPPGARRQVGDGRAVCVERRDLTQWPARLPSQPTARADLSYGTRDVHKSQCMRVCPVSCTGTRALSSLSRSHCHSYRQCTSAQSRATCLPVRSSSAQGV